MKPDATSRTPLLPRLDAAGLDKYFAAVRDSNPFTSVRISEPSNYDVDVPTVHADCSDRLIALANRAHRDRVGIGAMLYGAAGTGKSHLLSRLYRWAIKEDRACYVMLHNIMTDPERMPRYVLKSVVGVMSQGGRKPFHESRLYRLVHDALMRQLKDEKIASADSKQCEEQYVRLVERSAEAWHVRDPEANKRIHAFLFRFFRLAYPRKVANPASDDLTSAALAWLSGEEIAPESARALGLSVGKDEPAMLRGDEIEQVLLALFQLAHFCGQPFVLCLDQVEVIAQSELIALTRFLHVLIDHAVNLLVVISGVQETLLSFKGSVIPDAIWDRIAEYRIDVQRIGPEDVRRILEARLEKFHEPFSGVEAVKEQFQVDTLFPLGRDWLNRQLGNGLDFRTREALMWARDAWDDRQAMLARVGGAIWLKTCARGDIADSGHKTLTPRPEQVVAAIDSAVDRKIEESITQRRFQKGSLPPDAGNLAKLVTEILGRCVGTGLSYEFRSVETMMRAKGRLPAYDLLVRRERKGDGKAITSGVLFVTNEGTSATASLRRLLEDDRPPDHRILVTDEERRPLNPKPGSQGYEYYRDLTKLAEARFEHIKLDFQGYAALDALEAVVKMALGKDLDIEIPKGTIRPVTADEVVASHHRRDRYRSHPLLRPMLTEDAPVKIVEVTIEQLDEKDVRSHIRAQLSWRLGMTAFEVAKGYHNGRPRATLSFEETLKQIKEIAGRMHDEKLVHATPHDADLFLRLRA